jgi:hypothetical protein
MLHTKTDPKGIDAYIQRLQVDLYGRLAGLWPADTVHESYGRCQRNFVNGLYHAEVYEGTDYKDVLWDDRAGVVSFFGVNPFVTNGTGRIAQVHLIVFCDLKKLKPAAGARADEEVRIDYMNIIGKALYGFHYKKTVCGMANILKEYSGSLEKMKSIDSQPLHAFRIETLLHYNQNFSSTLKLK